MATGSTTTTITVTGTTEVEFPPSGGAALIGLSWVEVYHVDAAGSDQTFVHAPTDLNDDPDYYEGYKDPRVLGFGEITRALSDSRGQYEASEFSWTVADTDRLLRGWLGNAFQKFVINRQAVIRMIDDASRRLKIRPRTLVRGIIRAFKPRGPLHFEFRARDFVASLFGSSNDQKQIPQEAISRATFPACPTDAIGKPVPIIYGTIGDGVSASAAPVITGTAADGFYKDGGVYPSLGFGNLTSGASPVTGVSVTAGAGGSGSMPLTYNNEWGAMVTAVDGSGVETDPEPFYGNIDYGGTRGGFTGTPVPFATVDGTQKITVAWTASAGASKYRVYYGYYYYGFRVGRYVEVNAPTVSVDILTDADGNPTVDNQFWYYTVSAVCPDGETANAAPEAFGGVFFRRPIKIEWLAVTGATDYTIRRRGAGGTWDREWTVAAPTLVFEDDLLDTGVTYISGTASLQGGVPVTYVGTELDDFGSQWFSFLVCGHQVEEIPQLFQNNTLVDPGNYGVTILVPGQSGYSTYFSGHAGTPQYKTVSGRRYTVIYARGPQGLAASDGSQPFTCNVKGRTDAVDGTALSQLADIYKDFVINFGFQDSGGTHLSAPNWPADVDGTINSQVDEASFGALATVHAARLGGGYPGGIAFGLNGEFITLRDAIARLNVSADCWSGFNRNSQFFVVAFNEDLAVVSAARDYTQVNDIIKESLDIDPQTDLVENVVVYSYRRNYVQVEGQGDWDQQDVELPDATAITNLREERRGQTLELHGVRSGTVAADIAARRLVFYKEPLVPVTLETNLRGLSTELGDVILVSHTEGTSTSGWSLRPILVTRHITNPSKYKVRFVGLDVQRINDHYNP